MTGGGGVIRVHPESDRAVFAFSTYVCTCRSLKAYLSGPLRPICIYDSLCLRLGILSQVNVNSLVLVTADLV